MSETKFCISCNKEKALSEFYRSKKHKSGYDNKCKKCDKEYRKKYELVCNNCGVIFKGSYNQRKHEYHYCSQECFHDSEITKQKISNFRKTVTGEKHWNWKGEIKSQCFYCSKDVSIKRSGKGRENNRYFCCKQCENNWRSEYMKMYFKTFKIEPKKGKDSPKWRDENKVFYECDHCGKKRWQYKTYYEKSKNHFCSMVCVGKWMSENLQGKNNYNYNGGIYEDEREKNRLIEGYNVWRINVYRKYDYKCFICSDEKKSTSTSFRWI